MVRLTLPKVALVLNAISLSKENLKKSERNKMMFMQGGVRYCEVKCCGVLYCRV